LQNQKNSEKRNSKEKDKKLQTSELKEDVQNNLNNTANIDEKLKLFSLHIQVINDILKMRARIAELERILSETSRIRKYHATENVFGKKNTKDNNVTKKVQLSSLLKEDDIDDRKQKENMNNFMKKQQNRIKLVEKALTRQFPLTRF